MIVILCFSLLLNTLVEPYPIICPESQRVAHDGNCIEPFSLKFEPIRNRTLHYDGRQLFDTPGGCPPGTDLAHDGKCIEPFNLNIGGSGTPNVTETTLPSGLEQETPRSSLENSNAQEEGNKIGVMTTIRPGHAIFLACGFSQHVQCPYNYGYPVSSSYGYRSPCQSSCGGVQSTSRCQYLPCYPQYQQYQQYQQYPSYYPYAYNYNYNSNSNNRRVVNPYAYLYPRTYLSPSNSYTNIPVEIVDDVNVDTQKVKKLPTMAKIDGYANVPVEIIDNGSFTDFWKNIPKLRKVTTTA